ncbi:MAG: dTDP-4-dehydrorhamnose reductase [Thermodesulfobacteriota bacterium]
MHKFRPPYMIVGAKGMLGTDLVARLRELGFETVALDMEEIDITRLDSVRDAICRFRPGLVVNAAALTDVDRCESTPDTAFSVNGLGPGNLAEACRDTRAFLVHLSTDYVFNGTKSEPYREDDPMDPLGVYGKSKAQGEVLIRKALPGDHLIVRTQWLYGEHGKNFVETILRLARQRDTLSVVNDQWGSPTHTVDLCEGLIGLIHAGAGGTFHLTNSGVTSWHGFARTIIESAGIRGVTVAAVSTEEFGRPAPRPAYSALDNSRFVETVGTPLPPWEEALALYLNKRSAREARE